MQLKKIIIFDRILIIVERGYPNTVLYNIFLTLGDGFLVNIFIKKL